MRAAGIRHSLRKVEFGPFSHPQVTRPDEDEWRQAQRTACNEVTFVTVDRPQQRTNSLRLNDAGVMSLDNGSKGANQIASDVALCAVSLRAERLPASRRP